MPEQIEVALASREVRNAVALLQRWAKHRVTIAASCVSTFVLAESGLLDGERATTTWWLAPFFRKRYPNIALDASEMIVRSGKFVTSGAALSHLDLAIYLIRQKSPRLSELVAKHLIIDSRPSQSTYVLSEYLVHTDPVVLRFEQWARNVLHDGFSLEGAANAVGTSKRTLARKIQTILGKTPLSFFQDMRVERAVH